MPAIAYPHIVRAADGHLRIEGAHYKVMVLLEEHTERGWGVAELVEAHEMLTLAQAHALLAFYYDKQGRDGRGAAAASRGRGVLDGTDVRSRTPGTDASEGRGLEA